MKVDVCHDLPINTGVFQTFKLSECSTTASNTEIKISLYSGGDCSGILSHTFDVKLHSDCLNGTMFSCSEDPISLSEEYPAVGVYMGDSQCSVPAFFMTTLDGCRGLADSASMMMSCPGPTMDISMFNTSSECSGALFNDVSVEVYGCTESLNDLKLPGNIMTNLLETLEPYIGMECFIQTSC